MLSSPDVARTGTANATAWQMPELNTLPVGRHNAPSAEQLAYRRGWDEGRLAQSQEMSGSLDEMLDACRATQRAMTDASEVLRRQSVATVHALAVAIARHLIEWEVTQDPTHIRALVARAIALAPLNGPITVRVHPEDLALLQSIGGIPEPVPDSVELRWVADPAIGRGGCVLEGPASIVDGRVDRALLDIYERLGHE